MPRRKVDAKVVRVSFPVEAVEDFERLAKKLHMDLTSVIRFCASLQLAQFQTTIMKPDVTETEQERNQRATVAAESYLPDVFEKQPEPEPQPEPERAGIGFRPRSEMDDPGSMGLLTEMLSYSR